MSQSRGSGLDARDRSGPPIAPEARPLRYPACPVHGSSALRRIIRDDLPGIAPHEPLFHLGPHRQGRVWPMPNVGANRRGLRRCAHLSQKKRPSYLDDIKRLDDTRGAHAGQPAVQERLHRFPG